MSLHNIHYAVCWCAVATCVGCHDRALEWFGTVRGSRVIVDNPKRVITRACTYDPVVQRSYAECAKAAVSVAKRRSPSSRSDDRQFAHQRIPYPVPFALVDKTLWLRGTDASVSLHEDYRLVAPRLRK